MNPKVTKVSRSTVLKFKIAMALLIVPLAIVAISFAHYHGPTAGLAVALLWCVVMAAAKPGDNV